ncbi:cell division protein FtsL [bacterium MnTg02]|nr:cell division protein FtsL [bacterium MnTg02]
MLRLLNVVAVVLAGAFAFFLYSMKFETRTLESRTVELARKIKAERQSIAILKAEWSHLSRPERIERLARTHLGLRPLEVRQISELKYLRLPERVSPKPERETEPAIFTYSEFQFRKGGASSK